jgi:TonB family protein
MAPLTKDAVEVPKSAGSAAAPTTAPPQQSSGQLRSDAVSLEIPMKIHGSRVTEVVRGMTPHTEPFEEETSTMIVFPHGAVVRMATAVNAGQMLVLTNSRTRQDAICRVVKVRTFSKMQAYVEIEFTHAQPGYWGVTFPGSAPAPAAAKPATPAPAAPLPVTPPPAPAANAAPKLKTEAPAPEISWAPARPAAPTVPPPSNPADASRSNETKTTTAPAVSAPPPSRPAPAESAFISIGSHESVEVPATSTSRLFAKIAAESEKEEAKKSAAIESPQAPPTMPIHSLSMKELLGDDAEEQVSAAASAAAEAEIAPADVSALSTGVRSTFGSLTGGSILAAASAAAPAEDFGARLELGLGDTSASAPHEKNWLMIAAIITLVFAGAIAGIVYVRQHMGANAHATAAKQMRQASPPENIASVTPDSGAPAAESPAPAETRPNGTSSEHGRSTLNSAAPANSTVGEHANSNGSASKASIEAPRVETPREPSASQPPANDATAIADTPNTTQQQPKSSVTADMVASNLSAHPITMQRASDGTSESAPTIDPSAANGSSASEPTISISTNVPNLAAPEAKPEEPIRVGGQIKEPKLLNFRQPIYPLAAKTAHLEGDVVIETQLDKSGNVVGTKVVSGPAMLRESAIDALRHWKYAPSVLDGQPVAVQIVVTIKFRL